MGTALLLLGLLPAAAFAAGLTSGARRALREPRGPDAPMLLLVALTLAGYVAFTWGNPWFATLKGSYLLGLCVPFGFYASEALFHAGIHPRRVDGQGQSSSSSRSQRSMRAGKPTPNGRQSRSSAKGSQVVRAPLPSACSFFSSAIDGVLHG